MADHQERRGGAAPCTGRPDDGVRLALPRAAGAGGRRVPRDLHRAAGSGTGQCPGHATLEHHTFVLEEGTILGSGVGTHQLEPEDVFAIVGGTGRFAGASGTYLARQRHLEFGGDGAAEFAMTISL
jgi:hypothetical protein